MEIKTEADSDDMTEYPRCYDPRDDRPTTGMFGWSDSTRVSETCSLGYCVCVSDFMET